MLGRIDRYERPGIKVRVRNFQGIHEIGCFNPTSHSLSGSTAGLPTSM
jgi:hypothetical protein